MNRTEFVTITTIILFGVFVLGWFASWLIGRLTRPSPADLSELERKVRDTERERDKAIAMIKERDTRLSAAETELEAAMEGLRESRTEIEELRDYIERKLARR
jgi:septal ring factor EnvC (AmiA/AmiB activator)